MTQKAAVEIMVLNPDPAVHHHNKSVHENLWIKERYGKDNFLSIGVMLKEGTSELQFYFFEDCDKFPNLPFFSSLDELQEHLPPEKKDIFDRTHKVYLMGHGDAESKYGFGNYHAHDDFSHDPDETEQIYDDEFDALIQDILSNIHAQRGKIGITLEECHADNLLTAERMGYTQSFLERLSANYPHITFSGTGPRDDVQDLQESLASDSRASGGYPILNAPITAMGGSIWKNGNTVIFHHEGNQIAVRKSPFASTETAKSLKINTVNYAREILNQQTDLTETERKAILARIGVNRQILKIEDLHHEPDFPHQAPSANENERVILKQEQERYLQRVQAILSKDTYSDRDALIIALGLKNLSVFTGHDGLREQLFANKALLALVMVACGKVLIAGPSNDDLIDLLLASGVDINSVDAKGMTALHYAAQSFYDYRNEPLELVKKLLDSGANINAQNNKKHSPLVLAEIHSQKSIVMAGKDVVTLLKVTKTMQEADIPGVSIAIASTHDAEHREKIASLSAGVTDLHAETPVSKDSLFGAASLSKPVFAYLVLKLIALNQSPDVTPTTLGKFHLPSDVDSLDLDTPLGNMIPTEDFGDNPEEIKKAKNLTIRMILSHQTGLPIGYNPKSGPLKFDFEPGTEFGYSGIPFDYLQKVLEKLTGSTLDALAQTFVFTPLMPHSRFYRPDALYQLQPLSAIENEPYKKPRFGLIYLEKNNGTLSYRTANSEDAIWTITPEDCLSAGIEKSRVEAIFAIIASSSDWIKALEPYKSDLLKITAQREHTPTENAANSLYTTPEDYCRFIQGWTNDPALQYAFEPQELQGIAESHTCLAGKDGWARREGVSPHALQKVGYGLGMALQLNDEGKAIRAYHTGDMNQYRTCVGVDLEEHGLTTVCFANGENGHLLIEPVIMPNVKLKEGMDVFFGKFPFARKVKELQPDWREAQYFGIKKAKIDLIQKPDDDGCSAASLFRTVSSGDTSAETPYQHTLPSPFSTPRLVPPGTK